MVALSCFTRARSSRYTARFAATAANSRVFADMLRLMGAFSADDAAARARYRNLFVVLLTVVPVG